MTTIAGRDHPRNRNRATTGLLRRLAFVAVALACGPAIAQSTSGPAEPPVPETAGERGERGDSPRRRGLEGRPRGHGRGPLTDRDLERMILVVEDISAEWASSMRERLAEDPDAAREDFRRYGRRLLGLVMLKERNQPLYIVRVAELALKRGMREKAVRYHAVLASDPAEAASLKAQLRELAAESVDLELRARAMELEALDQAVRDLRDRLLGEVEDRDARIEEVWRSMLENDPAAEGELDPLGRLRPPEPGGRGPRPSPSGSKPADPVDPAA